MKTDEQLQQDVLAELLWEPSVEAARIGVEVRKGIVTLSGHVGSHGEKCNAEQAAQRVGGVLGLAVEIDVLLPGVSQPTDAELARRVEETLQARSSTLEKALKVTAEAGRITLTGEVEWEYQRREALGAVGCLLGVRGLEDRITITHGMPSKAIQSDLEATLVRRALREPERVAVEVEVDGSAVVLSGSVHSWDERNVVLHSAWGTPGVSRVTDLMTIAG